MIGPLSTTRDVYEDAQLRARDFWVGLYHPELAATLTYPGPFLRLSASPVAYRRRAPLIGEHNAEVLGRELGLIDY
jgi:formyl-CoA transferase